MLAKLFTYSLEVPESRAVPVEVEVDISPGAMPKTIVVGLAEGAVKESIHRIERALVNSGYHRPVDRVVINLSPAELPKEAASFDLPIAIGLLAASGQLPSERFERFAAVGELALEGTVRNVKGALAMAIAARERRPPWSDRTTLNGRMTTRQIRKHCKLDAAGESLLKSAMEEMGLSARAHDKILRVARTIADLDRSEGIRSKPPQ